jgi:hypothetical protein
VVLQTEADCPVCFCLAVGIGTTSLKQARILALTLDACSVISTLKVTLAPSCNECNPLGPTLTACHASLILLTLNANGVRISLISGSASACGPMVFDTALSILPTGKP